MLHLTRRLHPALGLLDDVPRLMRQMPFLPRRNMDVAPLGEGQGIELRWPGRVIVHPDVVQRQAGELLDACFERIGQAGWVGRSLGLNADCRSMVGRVDCHIGEVVAGLRRTIGTTLRRAV